MMNKKNFTKMIMILLTLLSVSLHAQQDAINNTEIANAVETELMIHEDVPSNMIDVRTEDGIVTLLGSTSNILAKDRAEDIAMAVKGVKGVVNNIVVVTEERPDAEIRTDILESLASDPATESFEVETELNQGRVTLLGEVDSWQEKQLVGYKAKQVRGVKEIENNIKINYPADRTDAQIKSEVKAVLKNDVRVDDGLIDLRVEDQVVHLSGTVGSATEKMQAKTLAYTRGVEKVDASELKVDFWARDPNLRLDKYEMKDDEQIRKAIYTALSYEPRVNKDKVEVQVKNGHVTLKGNFLSLKANKSAEETVKNIVGVTSVKNLIKVRPSIPANTELEHSVQQALMRNPDVERFEIMVDIINGMVYLTGQVDSYFEKYEAEDVAAGIYGVIGVANSLQVRDYNLIQERGYYPDYWDWNIEYPSHYTVSMYATPVDDENIESSIRSQLWWSPFINQDELIVEVDNGVATLTGEVATISEKRTATKNAYEGGASKVINNIEVVLPEATTE